MHTCIEIIRSFQNVSISCDIISSQMQIIHGSIRRLCSELKFRKSVFLQRDKRTILSWVNVTLDAVRPENHIQEYNSMPTLCILYESYVCSMCICTCACIALLFLFYVLLHVKSVAYSFESSCNLNASIVKQPSVTFSTAFYTSACRR